MDASLLGGRTPEMGGSVGDCFEDESKVSEPTGSGIGETRALGGD